MNIGQTDDVNDVNKVSGLHLFDNIITEQEEKNLIVLMDEMQEEGSSAETKYVIE